MHEEAANLHQRVLYVLRGCGEVLSLGLKEPGATKAHAMLKHTHLLPLWPTRPYCLQMRPFTALHIVDNHTLCTTSTPW